MYDSPRRPVTINDMVQYGYTWLGMVPMHVKQARRFFDSGKYCVFRLYPDGRKPRYFIQMSLQMISFMEWNTIRTTCTNGFLQFFQKKD